MSAEELRGASQTSNDVLASMQQDGKNVQWVESYVTDDAITVSISRPTPRPCANTPGRPGFPPTAWIRFAPPSVPVRPSRSRTAESLSAPPQQQAELLARPAILAV